MAWQDVSGSQLAVNTGRGRYQRTLGVGSTLSRSSHGRGSSGYRYYRLVASTADSAPAIDHVDFWLTGSGHYRNADRTVHLYNYLLAGAYTALRATREPLIDTAAVVDHDLVGPFQVSVPLTVSATGDQVLLDADGAVLDGTIEPGTDFYLRFTPGSPGITLTATTSHVLSGRVVTGVALAGPSHRLTPVALTTPTRVTIEFDITWDADQTCPDVVGECG